MAPGRGRGRGQRRMDLTLSKLATEMKQLRRRNWYLHKHNDVKSNNGRSNKGDRKRKNKTKSALEEEETVNTRGEVEEGENIVSRLGDGGRRMWRGGRVKHGEHGARHGAGSARWRRKNKAKDEAGDTATMKQGRRGLRKWRRRVRAGAEVDADGAAAERRGPGQRADRRGTA